MRDYHFMAESSDLDLSLIRAMLSFIQGNESALLLHAGSGKMASLLRSMQTSFARASGQPAGDLMLQCDYVEQAQNLQKETGLPVFAGSLFRISDLPSQRFSLGIGRLAFGICSADEKAECARRGLSGINRWSLELSVLLDRIDEAGRLALMVPMELASAASGKPLRERMEKEFAQITLIPVVSEVSGSVKLMLLLLADKTIRFGSDRGLRFFCCDDPASLQPSILKALIEKHEPCPFLPDAANWFYGILGKDDLRFLEQIETRHAPSFIRGSRLYSVAKRQDGAVPSALRTRLSEIIDGSLHPNEFCRFLSMPRYQTSLLVSESIRQARKSDGLIYLPSPFLDDQQMSDSLRAHIMAKQNASRSRRANGSMAAFQADPFNALWKETLKQSHLYFPAASDKMAFASVNDYDTFASETFFQLNVFGVCEAKKKQVALGFLNPITQLELELGCFRRHYMLLVTRQHLQAVPLLLPPLEKSEALFEQANAAFDKKNPSQVMRQTGCQLLKEILSMSEADSLRLCSMLEQIYSVKDWCRKALETERSQIRTAAWQQAS